MPRNVFMILTLALVVSVLMTMAQEFVPNKPPCTGCCPYNICHRPNPGYHYNRYYNCKDGPICRRYKKCYRDNGWGYNYIAYCSKSPCIGEWWDCQSNPSFWQCMKPLLNSYTTWNYWVRENGGC